MKRGLYSDSDKKVWLHPYSSHSCKMLFLLAILSCFPLPTMRLPNMDFYLHKNTAVYNRWTGLVDWTSGLDYWTDRFSFKTHIWRLFNEVQWREIASTVETLGLSWFYCPRLSTTLTIVAQSTGKYETEFQVIVRLVASVSNETVYLLIPVAVSALSPEVPPPSTSCSMLGAPGTDLKLWASCLL